MSQLRDALHPRVVRHHLLRRFLASHAARSAILDHFAKSKDHLETRLGQDLRTVSENGMNNRNTPSKFL